MIVRKTDRNCDLNIVFRLVSLSQRTVGFSAACSWRILLLLAGSGGPCVTFCGKLQRQKKNVRHMNKVQTQT